ncbi:MAG: DUF268 domain-containing protein [Bacteroidota bacterium]|jgi:SAM-dependent methyltransferase|nr:DUF268 domain-containing protein [Bacteroidota bacterium]MCA6442650.1 DUF268 domain-containing protein [Bacteroidota bacterium]
MRRISIVKRFYYLFLEIKRELAIKSEFNELVNKTTDNRFQINWSDRFIYLNDNTKDTFFDAHYIYHPAWAARIVKKLNFEKHIDISSTLHFAAIVSAFKTIEFYDYRPANLNLSNLTTNFADLTKLPFKNNSIQSISCMHVIEHIGLGRYGDPIDPKADLVAMGELKRVTQVGGNLLIVVPVGKPRIQFNAHRIYSYELITNFFLKDGIFKIEDFLLIPDDSIKNGNKLNASAEEVNSQYYGCGCWHFVKVK